MSRQRIYRDLDLDFLNHPNTGDLSSINNANAVIRAFRNLVFTNYYDAPFQPAKGNWLAGALFENDTTHTNHIIRDEILNLADNWEPRVSNVTVEVRYQENAYQVDIAFDVIGILNPVTFTLTLERTR